ncbi:dna repair protein rad18 [Saccharata proteae CBS 121410]|uniref:Dna repair protein rad18 n=1 Tax=Saccharata proteae CBS 121410 TaxID=1314787 RepID=A0A9P4HPG3_9PEZI|nr:dna repair protein rad18 [Saccharata proteae CBS 121410]
MAIQRKRQRFANDVEDNSSQIILPDDASENEDEDVDGDTLVPDDGHDSDLEALLSGKGERSRHKRLQKLVADKFRASVDNYPAENAIIEEVTCINFMCHSHLTVPLGPLINFIIGHNGSGKSAVLTALTVCLGTKATATNRAQSLKEFIKTGEESCMLSVKIKNHGSSSYKPELYGNSIIVERHFSRTGSSGFKIKNANGRQISTKRADLEDIIDAFQLQMDNPMNVLSQDMARQFLNSSTPSQKYKFFIDGTQLSALDADYHDVENSLEEAENKLELQRQNIEDHRKKWNEAYRKLEASNAIESVERKRDEAAAQWAWAQVEEQENVLSTIDARLVDQEAAIQQSEERAEEASRQYEAADERHKETERFLQSQRDEVAPLEEKHKEFDTQFKNRTTELKGILTQQRDLKSSIQGCRNTIKRLGNEVEQERKRQDAINGDEPARREEEIREAEARLEESKAAFQDHSRGFAPLDRKNLELNEKEQKLRPQLTAKREELRNQQNRVSQLKADRGNWMAAYDQKLPSLLKAIAQDTGFRRKPVGPIGRHVRLLKPEWSTILERQFGGMLNAFVVGSKADQNRLSHIMARVGLFPSIYIGQDVPLNTSGKEPADHLLTWIRVLKVDEPAALNQLIINQRIDQTVLCKDLNSEGSAIHRARPPNVHQIFTLRGAESRGDGWRLGYSSSGAEKTDPISAWRGPPRMQTDMASQVTMANEALNQISKELHELERQHQALQQACKEASQSLERHKRQNSNLKYESQRIEDEISEKKDALEELRPKAGLLESLYEQIETEKETLGINQTQFDEAQNTRDTLDADQRTLKTELDAVSRELDEAQRTIAKAGRKVQEKANDRAAKLRAKNAAVEAIDAAREVLEQVQADRDRQAQIVQDYISQATRVHSRVPVPQRETVESLERKFQELEKEVKRAQREVGGTREQLSEKVVEARRDLLQAEKGAKALEKLSEEFKRTLNERRSRLAKFRVLIADRAKITFTYLLSDRKFRGVLSIDSKSKQLDISVEPDMTTRGGEGRQTKTLSGGEKSFSTVCLLLSLWDAMGAPTRCLDEFDVFMDSVNRDISMKMIIGACRGSVSRQFIFITPQAMNNVSLGEDVKIIKMSDPERGQTTLTYGS